MRANVFKSKRVPLHAANWSVDWRRQLLHLTHDQVGNIIRNTDALNLVDHPMPDMAWPVKCQQLFLIKRCQKFAHKEGIAACFIDNQRGE